MYELISGSSISEFSMNNAYYSVHLVQEFDFSNLAISPRRHNIYIQMEGRDIFLPSR